VNGLLYLVVEFVAQILAALEPIQALPHEGRLSNGLRLHVTARFVPEKDGWGAPKLETTFTFTNETENTIILDASRLHDRLILSRLGPLDAVKTGQEKPPIECGGIGLGENAVLRIPPHGKHVLSRRQWCDTLYIPYGVSIGGEVADAKTDQYFKLLRPGMLTLAFLYRSDGPYAAQKGLAAFLRQGEKFWSGRVYSNAVGINVSRLHVQKPVPANYTGVWIDYYPSGKKERVGHYKQGLLDGPFTFYSVKGKKYLEIHYKAGIQHGPMIRWYPNGKKQAEEHFRAGIADGPCFRWYESGQIKLEGFYHNGKMQGRWLERAENGQVVKETFHQ
jgi:hypothetical protein